MFSYFQKSQRRRRILNNIKSRRIIIDKFNIPLGIVPSEYVYPIEGTKIELKNTDNGDMYSYKISVSAEKIFSLYMKLLKLFPSYGTMIIERISEDVNRDFDVLMSDPDVSLNEIRKVFKRYNELWVECGFVGFGVIDELTEFEIFINLDKEIEINTSYKNMKKINRILHSYKLLNDKVSFISDYEHMHYSLSSIVADEGCSEADEYVFDYYDIINNLKSTYGFTTINLNDNNNIIKTPKWWNVTVKGLGKCQKRTFISTYYIVANTIEEMETLIDEKMNNMNVDYYYIYDFYNVDPNDYNYESVNVSNIHNISFEKAPFGIWGQSDVFICKAKNIASYYINKNYARTY
ncbi:hypothetical protein [Brachyspira hyodysenteriae]|uniref:Uncharacterized protein n=1 Tax=Brachyspira hyodysenteriae ATCC 27164 TaxID=1266923 RepID=A0A3B6VUB5_BRAHO|nr:hypothetical protein [Brachyspira hyodysenteriae]ANN64395.1 hypothetical protein BHYOB78_11090 [Brachyspira hyodysenteriae ATCC 27164]AUJ49207.1 hypothetical protein BH718_00757 [Brachyspira hyodysenteriae]KLI17089.1 hypothetical protein SU46_09160 [Brachyspira hyodysenteriae]KLI18325.1 hypothetical protein SU45_03275 [Brachyspira hyodysenteriae]KLI23748.1 hypothetical protein SR30_09180 [Brachyspira hyodysenteriae]